MTLLSRSVFVLMATLREVGNCFAVTIDFDTGKVSVKQSRSGSEWAPNKGLHSAAQMKSSHLDPHSCLVTISERKLQKHFAERVSLEQRQLLKVPTKVFCFYGELPNEEWPI